MCLIFVEMGSCRHGNGKRKRRTGSVQTTCSKSTIISVAKLYSQYDFMSSFNIATQVLDY